jgi:hypothetical protein
MLSAFNVGREADLPVLCNATVQELERCLHVSNSKLSLCLNRGVSRERASRSVRLASLLVCEGAFGTPCRRWDPNPAWLCWHKENCLPPLQRMLPFCPETVAFTRAVKKCKKV